jgi:hypothetical protein
MVLVYLFEPCQQDRQKASDVLLFEGSYERKRELDWL